MIIKKIIRWCSQYALKENYQFAHGGGNCIIGRECIINSPSMIELGNNVNIGPRAVLYAIYKKIIFGDNVLLGPNVTIISGDHSIRKIGIPLIDNQEKLPSDDAEVVIGDETWIGANVTILKGVHIGRGCVVAAGAVVIRDVLPYTIVGGVPAKIINNRFSFEDAKLHERMLYTEDKRLNEIDLYHLK